MSPEIVELAEAAKVALDEMCRTTAPRDSFTDAVDRLDAAIAAYFAIDAAAEVGKS